SSANDIYLRPETAKGIFVNFKNVQRPMRKKMPLGVSQIGKSVRNEITPGNFTFRTREFEQMELEFFCKPGEDGKWYEYWKDFSKQWLLDLGLTEETCVCVIIQKKSYLITLKELLILSTNSRLVG